MAVNLSPPDPASLHAVKGVRLGIAEAGVRKANRRDLLVIEVAPGTEIGGDTPEQFAAFMRAEYALWGRIIGDNAIRVE